MRRGERRARHRRQRDRARCGIARCRAHAACARAGRTDKVCPGESRGPVKEVSIFMAWNQPGGQNNPWGRRPGGASDLDARVKEWQRKLESIFRGGGRGGNGTGEGGRGDGGSFALTAALVLLAVWLGSGFFQVKAAESAVIQRFGQLVAVKQQGWGWRWPWPIETVTKVNVQNVNSSDYKSRVLTADVNLVDLRFAVQYRYADPIKVLFRVRDPEATLKEVSEAAIREIVGQSNLDDVLVG